MSKYQDALFGQVVAQLKRDENESFRCDTHEVFFVSDRGCPGCEERERIIKLLTDACREDDYGTKQMLIRLIKGENK